VVAALALLLSLLLPFLGGCTRERDETAAKAAGAVPAFTVMTLSGGGFSLEDARGSVVVVNFWASWCGPCNIEAPVLEKVWGEYRDRGVRFIGIAVQDTRKDAEDFIARHSLSFPMALDADGRIMKAYKIYGIPKTVVIDSTGALVAEHTGPVDAGLLSAMIDEALSGPR